MVGLGDLKLNNTYFSWKIKILDWYIEFIQIFHTSFFTDIAHLVTSYLYPEFDRQAESMKRGLVEDLTMSFEDTNTKRRVWGREFTSDQAQDIKVCLLYTSPSPRDS